MQEQFSSEKLLYPIQFDLRIIHFKEGAESIQTDVSNILEKMAIPMDIIQTVAKPEGKYAKTAARVTVIDQETMHKMYAEIGSLSYVKALI